LGRLGRQDVIVTSGSLVVGPMVRATRNIPIVFLQVIDPVGSGLIESKWRSPAG